MTRKRVYGHYARILVDFDLKSNLATDVLVERDNFALYVGVEYEKMPSFYFFCQSIGHTVTQCSKKDRSKNRLQGKSEDTLGPSYIAKPPIAANDDSQAAVANVPNGTLMNLPPNHNSQLVPVVQDPLEVFDGPTACSSRTTGSL